MHKKHKHESRTRSIRHRLAALYGVAKHNPDLLNPQWIAETCAEAHAVITELMVTMRENGVHPPWPPRDYERRKLIQHDKDPDSAV